MIKTEFAEKIGSNGNTLRGWFNQEMPRPKRPYRVNIAKLLNITEDQLQRGLLGDSQTATRTSLSGPAIRSDSSTANDDAVSAVHYVPILNSISASALHDRSDADDRNRVAIPFNSVNAFALVVEGDCMSPRYEHGEIVIFETVDDVKRIENGRDYAIQYDADRGNESTFKRLYLDKRRPGIAIAQCINPATRPGAFQLEIRHIAKIGIAVMTVHK